MSTDGQITSFSNFPFAIIVILQRENQLPILTINDHFVYFLVAHFALWFKFIGYFIRSTDDLSESNFDFNSGTTWNFKF